MNKEKDVFDLKTLELMRNHKSGSRYTGFSYVFTTNEIVQLINSVKEEMVDECIKRVKAIKPNKIITELKLHWCIIEELKAIGRGIE